MAGEKKGEVGDIRLGPRAEGGMITPEEIHQVLTDEGYSADRRKEWLKAALTELLQERDPPPERAELIDAVKRAIARLQDGRPVSDDLL